MTTRVFQNGDLQAVQLPHGYEFAASEISIRRQGDTIILEPVKPAVWPPGFFDAIRIEDPAFSRPDQGAAPPAPAL